MIQTRKLSWLLGLPCLLLAMSCHDDDPAKPDTQQRTLTVENVLQAKPLVESGTFQGGGTPAVIMPGHSVTIRFAAAPGQALSFATMYGFSNDLFFAPENPGIALYDERNQPVEGDVSAQIKLWDNGTRVNQIPGANVNHPGTAEEEMIREVMGKDDQGNAYAPAADLVQATLTYEGDSYFTLMLKNTSGGTANETALSPGVWAVSYIAGADLLNPNPLFKEGSVSANGLTPLAESGDNSELHTYIQEQTGVFTPLSPVLVAVYNGIDNPLFTVGEKDAGNGLKALAQKGDASGLAAALKEMKGVKAVYVLADPDNTVLLPALAGQPGGKVTQTIKVSEGDRLAIASMYGFSNDWFFATDGNGIDATQAGDATDALHLFDDGTAVNQFPGAGNMQANLGGTPVEEQEPIQEVPNPNAFITLPEISKLIKVTIEQ